MNIDLGYGGYSSRDEDDPPDNRGKVMGDMADYALDCAMDDCEDYDSFISGRYSHQEAYDRGFVNELGGEERGPKGWNTLFSKSLPSDPYLKCNKCGSTDVVWRQVDSGKWCLHTGDKPHKCNVVDPVVRIGPNSNKKKLTGYKLVKCCYNCEYFFISGRCIKHKYETGFSGLCNDWEPRSEE
jgi:hypothetical protein